MSEAYAHSVREVRGHWYRIEWHSDDDAGPNELMDELPAYTLCTRGEFLSGLPVYTSALTLEDAREQLMDPDFDIEGDEDRMREVARIDLVERIAQLRGEDLIFDVFRAVKHARESWGCSAEDAPVQVAQLVERVRGYFLDHWWYCGCVVKAYHTEEEAEAGGEALAAAGLWRIESDSANTYIDEVVDELITECEGELTCAT